MLNKKLIARIRSLEEFLGIRYSEPLNKNDWGAHNAEDYGTMHELQEVVSEHRKKKKNG